MVAGYNELTPPTKFYRGPITGILPTYGHPYSADLHCASCGSTNVSKPSYKDGVRTFRCNKCNRKTRLAGATANSNEAMYEIRVNGYTEKEGLRRYDLQDALWEVLTNLDAHYASEKAQQYYGAYYDRLMDGDSADQGEALALDSDIMWVNRDLALNGGYVNGLNVGDTYELPDFPVSIARLGDKSPIPAKSVSGSKNKKPVKRSTKAPAKKMVFMKASGKKLIGRGR